MNYSQTIEFLYSHLPAYHRIGKAAYKDNLNNTNLLDDYFSHPHRRFKTIHIAGTNGKGSVSHMIASVLQEAGFRTGLYTSPHLKDFRERIKVNGVLIPKREVVSFVRQHTGILKEVNPSFFEMTVAMAYDYFARVNTEVAVIETGLGGRLDSTNIITPVLSVITNIGHDHMDLLGDTINKVAAEKAGIIKENIPVVIGETQPGPDKVFSDHALMKRSDIWYADKNFLCTLNEATNSKGERIFEMTSRSDGQKIKGTIPLGGDYQIKNLQTVFQVFKVIFNEFRIPGEVILKGIKNTISNTGLHGRWQILNSEPLTICDTGHNKEGLEYVIRQLMALPNEGLHFIIGFVSDKDLTSVLPLFPGNAKYYFTKASVPRALDEELLKRQASRFGLKGECYPTVSEALESASRNASRSEVIFIGGSTFVVAEVL